MKHAYLIIAHHEFEILKKLVQAIDDERNDIYIHFDKKNVSYPDLKTQYAGLYVLTNRTDVRWGDYSMVEAEYALFETAYRQGNYSYFHLLSGVDLPIKSQDYIHCFFKVNAGKEFIGYYQENAAKEIDRKMRRWHLFPNDFKNSNGISSLWKRVLRASFIRVQQLFGIYRNRHIPFKKGTQWVSLTADFISYLLQQKEMTRRIYSHTFCADEIFVQTICWNSPFRTRLYDTTDEGRGCMRMIGWEGNQIHDWEEKDFEYLMQSDALFARKFTSKHLDLVKRISVATNTPK